MRVLISGCGYVGCALGARLVRDGCEVFGLRRSPGALPEGVRQVAADFTAPDLASSLPSGLDYVFHTASPGISPRMDDSEREAAYRAAYVQGPSNLLAALRSRGESPRRVLLTSSTGVYARRGGEWVDEESPTNATGSGRWLISGEEAWLGGPYPAVVLRLAGIYGPGRTGSLDRARRYEPSRTETPAYTNRIHRDDCAGALRHLMLLESPEPVYIGADHEPATLAAMAEWLARHHPERAEEPRKSSGGGGRARTSKRCSNARLVGSGYAFQYPTFREGFAALLDG